MKCFVSKFTKFRTILLVQKLRIFEIRVIFELNRYLEPVQKLLIFEITNYY
jgi:hypothetical protein